MNNCPLKNLAEGEQVVMIQRRETSSSESQKIWTCMSPSFINKNGEEVVFLDNLLGSYPCMNLSRFPESAESDRSQPNSLFDAFRNDSQSLTLDELTFENNDQRVAIFGSANITQDKNGLALAKDIQKIINQMVLNLESLHLPDEITYIPSTQVDNPFN